MRFSARGRLLFLIIFPALLAPLEGCASFYLHDAATQKQTESAKSALDAIKTDPIFDSEASYLDGLQITEGSALKAKFAAQRDQDILRILNGPGPGGDSGLTTLNSRIDGYLMSLVGVTDARCDQKLWRIVGVDPSKKWGRTTDLTQFVLAISQEVDRIKGSPCSTTDFPALLVTSPSSNLDVAFKTVLADLTNIQNLKLAADTAKEELNTALSDAENKLSAGKSSATDFRNDLKKLETALTDANPLVRQFASATLSTEVSATIDALSPPSSTPQSALTNEERSGVAVIQALFGVGDAFASPPRVPHPNALAAAQSWLNYIDSQAAIELQNKQVLLKDHQGQFAAVLTEIYYLSKAGQEVQSIKIDGRKVPEIYYLPSAGDEFKKIKLANGKQKPDGTEGLADLIDSKDGGNARAIDGAVMYYAAAWTRGFAVDSVESRIGYIDQRRAKLASGRAACAAWLGSLKPAVETLASYGAGGFDPQIVAQLIQALGVAGVAVGVNK
jgi:hypothetical protein